jgi:hypothetical protein
VANYDRHLCYIVLWMIASFATSSYGWLLLLLLQKVPKRTLLKTLRTEILIWPKKSSTNQSSSQAIMLNNLLHIDSNYSEDKFFIPRGIQDQMLMHSEVQALLQRMYTLWKAQLERTWGECCSSSPRPKLQLHTYMSTLNNHGGKVHQYLNQLD